MIIVCDSFIVGSIARPLDSSSTKPTDRCKRWIEDCVNDGHDIIIPAITYYETLRELQCLRAQGQINRLNNFVFSRDRFLPLTTAHLIKAAELWGTARRNGFSTADRKAIDGDVILAAQALSLPSSELVVATTNPAHLLRYVNAALWTDLPR